MKIRQNHFMHKNFAILKCMAISVFFSTIVLLFTGCCIESPNKPGVILRGDWAIELNRTKAIEKISETVVCDDDAKPRRSRKHRFPCGRFGCLKCALTPSTGEIDDDEPEDDDSENSNQMDNQNPNCFYPPGVYPIPPFASGMSGPIGPLGGPIPIPPPVNVINPNTGQRLVMQPVLPGQPGMLVLNAVTGQPVVVSPVPLPPNVSGIPGYAQPGMLPGQPLPPMGQMGPITLGMPGFTPGPAMNPNMPPMPPVSGVGTMINPATGLPMPGPYDNVYRNNSDDMHGNPALGQGIYAQTKQNSESENDSNDSTRKTVKKSPMPLPKFHGVPTHPVYQRTEGIAQQEQKEEEERLRKIQLERVLGTKVPEGTRISPNGVNQQLIQTSSGSDSGGGSANGSPFYSISSLLGPLQPQQQQQETASTVDKGLRQTQQTQLLFQKQQLKEMQKKLDKMEQDKQAELQRKQLEAELRAKFQAKESKKQSIIGSAASIIPGSLSAVLSPNEQSTNSRNKLPPTGKQLAQNLSLNRKPQVQPPIQQDAEIHLVSQNSPIMRNERQENVEDLENISVSEEEDESVLVTQNDEYEILDENQFDESLVRPQPVIRHHNHIVPCTTPQPLRQVIHAPKPTMNGKSFPYSKDSDGAKSGALFDMVVSKLNQKPRIDPRQYRAVEQRLAAQRASVQDSLGLTPIADEEPSSIKQVSSRFPAPIPDHYDEISTED